MNAMPRCRKAETPAGSSTSSLAVRETLPPDLLAAGVRRLGTVALLTAVIMPVFVAAMALAAVGAGQARYPGIIILGDAAVVVASLGMFAVTRRAGLDPGETLDRALVYEVLVGFLWASSITRFPVGRRRPAEGMVIRRRLAPCVHASRPVDAAARRPSRRPRPR